MKDDAYALSRFVGEMRGVVGSSATEDELIARLCPLVQRFAGSGTWRETRQYEVHPQQGFGVHLLHEEPDHSLAVFAVSWRPGGGTPPHDHGDWGIVVGVDGAEKNVFWERIDDRTRPGYAELRKLGEKVFVPGDVVAMPTGTIHSVSNESDRVTLSLHVYGRHLNFAKRSQFDPDKRTEEPFLVRID